MKVSEKALLKAGFSHKELNRIKHTVKMYDGTLEEGVKDLANLFRTLIWISSTCLVTFILVVFLYPKDAIIFGLSMLIAVIIVILMQPPALSYKCWRYWKLNGN